jgi:steroid delta-isomerase-like uncharacterized protein
VREIGFTDSGRPSHLTVGPAGAEVSSHRPVFAFFVDTTCPPFLLGFMGRPIPVQRVPDAVAVRLGGAKVEASENKAIVRRLYGEAFNRGDLVAFEEIVAPDFKNHGPSASDRQGRGAYWEAISKLRSALPDLDIRINDQLAEGDKVATRVTVHGTFRGEFAGMSPSDEPVILGGIAIFRLKDGRLIEGWSHSDPLIGFAHTEHEAHAEAAELWSQVDGYPTPPTGVDGFIDV